MAGSSAWQRLLIYNRIPDIEVLPYHVTIESGAWFISVKTILDIAVVALKWSPVCLMLHVCSEPWSAAKWWPLSPILHLIGTSVEADLLNASKLVLHCPCRTRSSWNLSGSSTHARTQTHTEPKTMNSLWAAEEQMPTLPNAETNLTQLQFVCWVWGSATCGLPNWNEPQTTLATGGEYPNTIARPTAN